MGFRIKVIINGLKEEVPEGSTIYALIRQFNELDSDLIVEHNGQYVYRDYYESTVVAEDDRIEFINPNLGG